MTARCRCVHGFFAAECHCGIPSSIPSLNDQREREARDRRALFDPYQEEVRRRELRYMYGTSTVRLPDHNYRALEAIANPVIANPVVRLSDDELTLAKDGLRRERLANQRRVFYEVWTEDERAHAGALALGVFGEAVARRNRS
jgi:hypothetical protein